MGWEVREGWWKSEEEELEKERVVKRGLAMRVMRRSDSYLF